MLPRPALLAADRIITALMTLTRAVVEAATKPGAPVFPANAAETLFHRLTALATTLIRISTFGVRAKPKPKPDAATPPDRTPPDRAPPNPAPGLPRRPGWLLAVLPDVAPAIAADLRALLADPAIATLLAAAPSLHRPLRPLLRALGLTPPPPPSGDPPPHPQPSEPHPTPPPAPTPPPPATHARPSQPAPPKSTVTTPCLCTT